MAGVRAGGPGLAYASASAPCRGVRYPAGVGGRARYVRGPSAVGAPLDERLEFSSWELQVTALSRFYDWTEREGLAAAVPFTVATGKRMVQSRLVEDPAQPDPAAAVKAARESAVPGVRLPRSVPLRPGRAGPGWAGGRPLRSRFPGRNAAMGGLLLGTGMRSREFTHLLVHEVPRPGSTTPR